MKLVLAGLLSVVACIVFSTGEPEAQGIVVSGSYSGNLTPCGCVSPMMGGILRKATLLKQMRSPTDLWVEVGPFLKDTSRQSQLKLDAIAEFAQTTRADAVGLTAAEVSLDPALLRAAQSIAGGRLVQSQLPDVVAPWRAAQGWLIGALSPDPRLGSAGTRSLPLEQAWTNLVTEAGDKPVLVLWDGSQDSARSFAEKHPRCNVLVYPSPSPEVFKSGSTILVGTGERGKYLGRLDLATRRFRGTALGPEIKDDGAATAIYQRYLSRVDGEHLLSQVPRTTSPAFAGSKACASCHGEVSRQWKSTGHAHALKTLERTGNDQDPDCVGCHVVGLASKGGFTSKIQTPQLADVGCESCHGPARDHARKPRLNRTVADAKAACRSCHNPEHSPAFDFSTYWKRVMHRRMSTSVEKP